MNASGARCVTQQDLHRLGESHAGAIVTKSMTPQERSGNPEPRYVSFPGGSINSMGLPNLGYHAYTELIPDLRVYNKPIVASIAGLKPSDFLEAVTAVNDAKPDLMEINLSCPNIPGKPQIGYDLHASEDLLLKIRDRAIPPIGVKLPPYFDPVHHEAMADMLTRVGVAFISAINSVGNGLVLDAETETVVIKPKGGFGGIGGRIIKPVALANVRAFYKLVGEHIQIIGTGGVETGQDVFEHLLCGASAVQLGTVLVNEHVEAFERLERELMDWLRKKGYSSVAECRGKLKEL
ncbi:MAG: dihydroorotate dehydrogenase A (fumarate) [Nitrospirales bacterium]|nr:MAG: dihydroorotate dehydrogenase A (fumarate) [Nitrospirales bacterium]